MSEPQQHRVVVVGPDGQPMGEMDVPAGMAPGADGSATQTERSSAVWK